MKFEQKSKYRPREAAEAVNFLAETLSLHRQWIEQQNVRIAELAKRLDAVEETIRGLVGAKKAEK